MVPWILITSELGLFSKVYGPAVLLQMNLTYYLGSIPVLLLSGPAEKALDKLVGPTASLMARLVFGLSGCLACAAAFPFLPANLHALLGITCALGALAAVAFSSAYQLVICFRQADTIALGIGCVGSGPLVLAVQLALGVGSTPTGRQWVAMFEIAAGIVLAGLLCALSLFGQYWDILSGKEEYRDELASGSRTSQQAAALAIEQRHQQQQPLLDGAGGVQQLQAQGALVGCDASGGGGGEPDVPGCSAAEPSALSGTPLLARLLSMPSADSLGSPLPRSPTKPHNNGLRSIASARVADARRYSACQYSTTTAPLDEEAPGGGYWQYVRTGGSGRSFDGSTPLVQPEALVRPAAASAEAHPVPPLATPFASLAAAPELDTSSSIPTRPLLVQMPSGSSHSDGGRCQVQATSLIEETLQVASLTAPVLLAFSIVEATCNLLFSFFTYVPSDGTLGARLPQALFFCRIFANLAGRTLPRIKAFVITSPTALLLLACNHLWLAALFFTYIHTRWLQHDVAALALVAVIWLMAGYVNTVANIVAPNLCSGPLVTRASALLALTNQVAHTLGLALAAMMAVLMFGTSGVLHR